MGNDSHLPKYGEGPKHEIVTDTVPPPRVLENHDYERGETQHHMHTDPLCLVCGLPRKANVHA